MGLFDGLVHLSREAEVVRCDREPFQTQNVSNNGVFPKAQELKEFDALA